MRLIRRILQARSGVEIVRFGLVGATGVVVNSGMLYLLHGVAAWPLVVASLVAVEAAIVNNFVWNDRWTFSGREKTSYRFVRFNLVSLGGLVVNVVVLTALVGATGTHYLVANLFAIGTATTWNFAVNARWTWLDSGSEFTSTGFEPMRGEVMTDDLVIVPTYNEADNLETLVERILAEGPFAVLVVDDDSPDGTGVIADRLASGNPGRVAVIHRRAKEGLGAAYRAGFHRALESDARRIYQMDADFSHDPRVLTDLRRTLLNGADLVIGSRYVPGGGVEGWPLRRKALSRGGSIYAGTILALPQRDLTGGFKGWRRETLAAARVDTTKSNGYAFQVETTYRACLAGARVVEVPITFRDRENGVSKMGLPIVLEAVRVVPSLRLRTPEVSRLASTHPAGAGRT